jgi:hypothetical protein
MTSDILLLTATIRPRAQPGLALADPALRLHQYEHALGFYSRLIELGKVAAVVFAENSGYDLSPLRERFKHAEIEWISCSDLDYPSTYHRGYGEFRLVEHAMRNAKCLRAADAGSRIWKVTGRYVIENLASVMRRAPDGFDVYCDVRGPWAEMSVMAWTQRGYAQLVDGLWREFATGMAPELILASRLRAATGGVRVVRRFHWPARVRGQRGSDGSAFDGRWSALRFALDLLQRRLLLTLNALH